MVTAQSSTEAEYMAVLEAAKQAIWIRHFLYTIGKEAVYNMAPMIIYEDNQGVIKLADNPVNHLKTKHIVVHYHTIQEHIANSEIQLEYLPTDWMVADGLTKATNHVSKQPSWKGQYSISFFFLSLFPLPPIIIPRRQNGVTDGIGAAFSSSSAWDSQNSILLYLFWSHPQ